MGATFMITTAQRPTEGIRAMRDGETILVSSWAEGEMSNDLPAMNASQARSLAAALLAMADNIERNPTNDPA
jgi:hypothetical protein